MLGELARIEHRFDDAVVHIERAAETSGRLGFLQTEAYQRLQPRPRAVPGRRLRDRRGHVAARRSRRPRRPATCAWRRSRRVHLGRVLRALGRTAAARAALEAATAWHRAAGGGEQAALGECLLAASTPRMAPRARGSGSPRPRRRPPRRRRAGRDLRARRACPPRGRRRRRRRGPRPLPAGRPAHGGRVAFHHRPRPHGRPRRQAVCLSCSTPTRWRSPRWCSATKASRPPTTIAMPAIWR